MEKIFNPEVDKPEVPSRQEVKSFLENKKLEEYLDLADPEENNINYL